MADIRTLKLALLADTKQFIQGLDKADKETRNFSSKLGDALKKGALAFAAVGAAAGAMAIKIGVDAVKGAIEDAKAQATLAQTLRNTTKATDQQIKSVEDYITKTERASAVNAELLRPSLDRLVRSTGDVTKAQKLQKLALDIAAGTGKDLTTVTEALGKAYDGNLGALKRIGVPLDDNIIKTKDFDAATIALSETFKGQADIAANTFAGRMEKISLAIDEAKDTLGFALLPLLERFAIFATETLVPALQGIVNGLTGGDRKAVVPSFLTFGEVVQDAETLGYDLGVSIRDLATSLGELSDALFNSSDDKSGLQSLITGLTTLTNTINRVLRPFIALIELSQKFAEINSGRQITIPDWIRRLNLNTVPNFLLTPQQRENKEQLNNRVNITINSGTGDPNAIARAVTNALNTSGRYGTTRLAT
jgi:hypothetical protein